MGKNINKQPENSATKSNPFYKKYPKTTKIIRIGLCSIAIVFGFVVISGALLTINGLFLAKQEKPILTFHSHSSDRNTSGEIRIMAYNIAKGFIHKGGIQFEKKEAVLARLKEIAAIIQKERADLVFLSEAIWECAVCPINQVDFLARSTGMNAWAFGENYNLGFPFYRIVGGNAILSKWPLEAVANPSLSGRKPFYITTNNRRFLVCLLKIKEKEIFLTAVHNDSFSLKNNLIQTQQILDYPNC
ncbi:MAG: hypothetical protein HUU50_20060 [Candidatus Brocadiae bacterium]|nr:hypothetical protein [Candidatus Brocadiia bacterium]